MRQLERIRNMEDDLSVRYTLTEKAGKALDDLYRQVDGLT